MVADFLLLFIVLLLVVSVLNDPFAEPASC